MRIAAFGNRFPINKGAFMSLQGSLWLFQSVFAVGLAIWLTIAVVDNVRAFHELVRGVGVTMSMTPLKQSPAVPTILLGRAVTNVHWHRLAVLALLALKLIALIACWVGCYTLFFGGGLVQARPWLNVALATFAILIFAMHLAGLWFAYWIRQDDLQRGHLALLIWALALFFLFNGQWS